jgi:hypothetical protein
MGRFLFALVGCVGLLLIAASSVIAMPADPPPPPPARPPGLFITVYDWSLGGINCNEDCGQTSLTTTGPELFGWTAACPVAWLGHINTTVVTIWGQEYWCIDAFGDEVNQRLTTVNGRRVYRIDIADSPPAAHPWNQEWVPWGDWSKEWRPMAEFNEIREARRAATAVLGD